MRSCRRSVEAEESNTQSRSSQSASKPSDRRPGSPAGRRRSSAARSTTWSPTRTGHRCSPRCCRRSPAPWRWSRPAGCRSGRSRYRSPSTRVVAAVVVQAVVVLDLSDQYETTHEPSSAPTSRRRAHGVVDQIDGVAVDERRCRGDTGVDRSGQVVLRVTALTAGRSLSLPGHLPATSLVHTVVDIVLAMLVSSFVQPVTPAGSVNGRAASLIENTSSSRSPTDADAGYDDARRTGGADPDRTSRRRLTLLTTGTPSTVMSRRTHVGRRRGCR